MEGVVLRRLSAVSCGDESGVDLPGVTYQTGHLRVPIVLLVAMLLVGCASRSPAGKTDCDVSSEDPAPLMLVGFPRDYRYCVSKCVGVEKVDAEPIADCCMRLRTVTLQQLPGSRLSRWV